MRIAELFTPGAQPVFSFEFFPPKTEEGHASLIATIRELAALAPSFVSVTYGAGGSTRDRTLELVAYIKRELGIEAMAHLTCVGSSRTELSAILDRLESADIENVIALRGAEFGKRLIERMVTEVADIGQPEGMPGLAGRFMIMVLTPKK